MQQLSESQPDPSIDRAQNAETGSGIALVVAEVDIFRGSHGKSRIN